MITSVSIAPCHHRRTTRINPPVKLPKGTLRIYQHQHNPPLSVSPRRRPIVITLFPSSVVSVWNCAPNGPRCCRSASCIDLILERPPLLPFSLPYGISPRTAPVSAVCRYTPAPTHALLVTLPSTSRGRLVFKRGMMIGSSPIYVFISLLGRTKDMRPEHQYAISSIVTMDYSSNRPEYTFLLPFTMLPRTMLPVTKLPCYHVTSYRLLAT